MIYLAGVQVVIAFTLLYFYFAELTKRGKAEKLAEAWRERLAEAVVEINDERQQRIDMENRILEIVVGDEE